MIGFYLLKNKDKNLYVMRGIGYFRSRFTEPADRLRQPPKRSELLGGCTDPAADLVKSRSFKAWSKREMSAKDRVIRKSWPVWAGAATRSFVLASLVALLPSLSLTQATSIQIPSTTPLVVRLFQHVPMKTGESLEGRLLYPSTSRAGSRNTGGHRFSRSCNPTRFRPKPPDSLASQG